MQKVTLCKVKIVQRVLHQRLSGFWIPDYHLRGGERCYALVAFPPPPLTRTRETRAFSPDLQEQLIQPNRNAGMRYSKT